MPKGKYIRTAKIKKKTIKCIYCGKEIGEVYKKQVGYMLKQHILSKPPGKV